MKLKNLTKNSKIFKIAKNHDEFIFKLELIEEKVKKIDIKK